MPDVQHVTALLSQIRDGDDDAAARLLPIVYDELRALAGHYFQAQPAGHTLQPTAVVHEAFLKLVQSQDARWEGRSHFLAVAAKAMRQVLTDHARQRKAGKRGGGLFQRVTIDDAVAFAGTNDLDLLQLNEALDRLAALSERQARIVELRVFGGMTIEETASAMAIGPTTVKSEWLFGKAWLKKEFEDARAP